MDIETTRIAEGTVVLQDAPSRRRWSVEVAPFDLGVFTVTEELVAELIGETAERPRRPASGVTWLRAIRLCNAASEWEGLDPAYSYDGRDVTWHDDADGYRLPTEAEWELACRAGSTGAHYGPLGEIAWTAADGLARPADVGLRLPNLFGLFDTLGNVWEWCWDEFAEGDDARVIRGGSFLDDAYMVRASTRKRCHPSAVEPDVGLRLARSVQRSDRRDGDRRWRRGGGQKWPPL